MDGKMKQCILNIVGYFVLVIGGADFIIGSFRLLYPNIKATAPAISIWIIPSILLLITGSIFINLAKRLDHASQEDESNMPIIKIKIYEKLAVGILCIVYFARYLLMTTLSQIITLIQIYDMPSDARSQIMDTEMKVLLSNITIVTVYILGIGIGIYLVIRSKRIHSISSAVPAKEESQEGSN